MQKSLNYGILLDGKLLPYAAIMLILIVFNTKYTEAKITLHPRRNTMAESKKPKSSGSVKKSGADKGKKPTTYNIKSKNTKKGNAKKTAAEKKAEELRERRRNGLAAQLTPFILIILAVLMAMFIYLESLSGAVGGAIGAFVKGLFSGGAVVIPPMIIILALMWRRDAEEGQNGIRIACNVGFIILLSAVIHILGGGSIVFSPVTLYKEGLVLDGGGFIGGLIGTLLWKCFRVAAPIMLIGGLAIIAPLLIGITPRGVFIHIAYRIKIAKERRALIAEENELLREDRKESRKRKMPADDGVIRYGKYSDEESSQLTIADEPIHQERRRKHSAEDFEADIPMPDGDVEDIAPEIDEGIFITVKKEEEQKIEDVLDGRLSDKIDGFSPDPDVIPEDIYGKFDAPEKPHEEIPPVAVSTEAETPDLGDIFTDPDDAALFDKLCAAYMPDEGSADTDLKIRRDTVSEPVSPKAEETVPEEPEYIFPPLNLLSPDNSKKDAGVRDELRENAAKLVDTLKSFNVKTKIVDVCRGPTITRYELMPESGTKVRAIANLTDDIALAFAAKGVRIEAPVPGKSAVGIEVPNKTAATVYLRTLLENEKFTDAKSKLHSALGEDVAGEAVYLDIAKMPHLLVAGATGMGKSVCINCLIVSLLYRAAPDEVKFILIDPKKVEFNLYSGLPHLLVPVVSDPKKAAGSLSWAVSEMERRFNILEDARVRDITKYNSIARINEGMEVLPQIVIIIDELADLMMTASDDVEKSIARLAQKARAAGMHLIIGTQRPSVDVITGLIKNNIPSRISCAVTSQVDSRTILDRAGAEKLIGRGDMLYKPVGIDPIRVQGAFVSESEVEAIVEFIKTQNTGKAEGYSEDVIEQIEREAEKCGNAGKKKTAISDGDDGGEDDPMLRAALELAVDSRKISTSLIQRKLSLGYGRAAKIIDRMEELGYVSAPDGQKPREVLISKEEFMEMVLRDESP